MPNLSWVLPGAPSGQRQRDVRAPAETRKRRRRRHQPPFLLHEHSRRDGEVPQNRSRPRDAANQRRHAHSVEGRPEQRRVLNAVDHRAGDRRHLPAQLAARRIRDHDLHAPPARVRQRDRHLSGHVAAGVAVAAEHDPVTARLAGRNADRSELQVVEGGVLRERSFAAARGRQRSGLRREIRRQLQPAADRCGAQAVGLAVAVGDSELDGDHAVLAHAEVGCA